MRRLQGLLCFVTGLILVTLGACKREPGRTIDVLINSPRPPSLTLSNHWNFGSSLLERTVKSGLDYRASIPDGRLPVAFVDLNMNGRLEVGAEPSGRCRKSDRWDCQILSSRLTVHRVQGPDDDVTLIFGEAYDLDAMTKDEGAQLCNYDDNQCTSTKTSGYFNTGSLLTVKLCDINSGRKADYGVELRSRGRTLVRSRIKQPPPMKLESRLTPTADGYLLTGRTSLSLSRLLVWSAEMRGNEIAKLHWSSEDEPSLLILREHDFEMRLPRSLLRSCRHCVVGVQAVADIDLGAVTVSSEGSALFPAPTETL